MNFFLFFATVIVGEIKAQISCKTFFKYVRNNDEIQGFIKLKAPFVIEHKIRVELSVGMRLPSDYIGEINLSKDTNSALREFLSDKTLLYSIKFPIQHPLPICTTIHYNDQQICASAEEIARIKTKIVLNHKFNTGLSGQDISDYNKRISSVSEVPKSQKSTFNQPNYSNQNLHETDILQYSTESYHPTQQFRPNSIAIQESQFNHFTPQAPIQYHSPTRPQFVGDNRESEGFSATFQCGIRNENPNAIGLIINGAKGTKYDFPWLVAHHHRFKGFICGGTLVSRKVIVTAAHCIQDKKEKTAIKAYDSTYFMGKYALNSLLETGYISSGVREFYIHSGWNPQDTTYDSDIAIAILLKRILFADNIKPICIPPQLNGHSDLVGKSGLVAGWGITEKGTLSETPAYISIPVASDTDCLRSNIAFASLTSEKTFCAGDRKRTIPCAGDSGGAFITKNDGKFFIRGIISSAILEADFFCSTQNYAVFTDVSFFSNWINGFITNYG